MERILHPGRRIWVVCAPYETSDGMTVPGHTYGTTVMRLKQFLPRGVIDTPTGTAERKQSLLQLWTDPGGMRTIVVADIRLKDPGRVNK